MSVKPNYRFKAEVLKQGWCSLQKDISLSYYSHYAQTSLSKVIPCKYDIETASSLQSFFSTEDEYKSFYLEAEKINHANYQRVKRLKARITKFLTDGSCCFLTLTFKPSILQSTSSETRRRYISRFLKSLGVPYVANKDFGKKNGREHYHAVVQVPRIDNSLFQYGFIFSETIHKAKDYIKLSKYIAKLTNHAIKETTKRSVLLYSRD